VGGSQTSWLSPLPHSRLCSTSYFFLWLLFFSRRFLVHILLFCFIRLCLQGFLALVLCGGLYRLWPRGNFLPLWERVVPRGSLWSGQYTRGSVFALTLKTHTKGVCLLSKGDTFLVWNPFGVLGPDKKREAGDPTGLDRHLNGI
jgi:hypothetical protein